MERLVCLVSRWAWLKASTPHPCYHFCRRRELGITFGVFFEPVNEGAIWVKPDGARPHRHGTSLQPPQSARNRRLIRENDDPEADIDIVATLDENGAEAVQRHQPQPRREPHG